MLLHLKTTNLIGVSLSEPHINCTSVRELYIYICTMPSQKIKGTACTIYSVNHRLPAVYTVVMVYGSYTLEYNCHTPRASCFHGYKRENA